MNGRAPSRFTMDWCRDPGHAEAVAHFFAAEAQPAYISHSELQFGRAEAPGRWSDTLLAQVTDEARRAIENPDAATGQHLALATAGSTLGGIAFVSLRPDAPTPFAILDDLLIAPAARGQGLGGAFVTWIGAECRRRGLKRLFLESGLVNDRAHHFFEQQGFAQTSIVMMRDL